MRDIIKPSVILFIICLIVTAALAFTFNITKDTIAARASLDAENARKEVLVDAESFRQLEDAQIESIVKNNPKTQIVKEVFEGIKAEKIIGYVFSVTNKGYGGEIDVIVGIDTTGKVIGVKVGDHSETPGLGTKATDQSFLSQLAGITPKEALKVVKVKGSDKDEDITAVSGATTSSKAIVGATQAALDFYRELVKEGGVSQ